MKIVHLLLVTLVTCTIGLSTLPGTASAASNKKEVTSSTHAAKTTVNTKKALPHDVNINTADKKLLVRLPGVGPVTADSIIQYRKDNGQFKSIDDLTKVKGIGSKTLAKLKPCLMKL